MLLLTLLEERFVPVVASLAGDGDGRTCNVNADTVAESLAVALRAQKLIFLTGAPGVLRDRDDPSRPWWPSPTRTTCAAAGQRGHRRGDAAQGGGLHPRRDRRRRADPHHRRSGPDALLLEVFTGAGCGTMIVGRKEKATYESGEAGAAD